MTPADLSERIDQLGLSERELAHLVGRHEAWLRGLLLDEQPVPHWLDLLTLCWSTYPGALATAARPRTGSMPGELIMCWCGRPLIPAA